MQILAWELHIGTFQSENVNDNFIGCSIIEHQWNICSNNFKPIVADVLMRRLAYDRKIADGSVRHTMSDNDFCDVSMQRSVWETGFMRRMNTALRDNELMNCNHFYDPIMTCPNNFD